MRVLGHGVEREQNHHKRITQIPPDGGMRIPVYRRRFTPTCTQQPPVAAMRVSRNLQEDLRSAERVPATAGYNGVYAQSCSCSRLFQKRTAPPTQMTTKGLPILARGSRRAQNARCKQRSGVLQCSAPVPVVDPG